VRTGNIKWVRQPNTESILWCGFGRENQSNRDRYFSTFK